MDSPACHRLELQFDQAWPVGTWSDTHVVLGVSGGADSVAMLRAAAAMKNRCGGTGRLYVGHLNHSLRAADADADEAWLAALCQRLTLPFEAGHANVRAIADWQGDGLEAAARHARYTFLTELAERLGARFVAVAHTAEDQVETVLHRLLRGTGVGGLAGMPSARPLSAGVALVRPLLYVRRHEVLEYLAALQQDYRTDQTNVDSQWTRNRLRHELLPILRERFNRDVDQALLRLAAQAAEAQQVIAQIAADLVSHSVSVDLRDLTASKDEERVMTIRFDCRPLADNCSIVVREVLKQAWREAKWPLQAMGFDQWQQLAELVRGGAGRPVFTLPGNIRATREEGTIVLERLGLP